MDKLSSFIVIAYSFMLLIGGFIGYVKAHSQASLMTGVLSALIVIVAWELSIKRPKVGYLFIASISLILCMFFLRRFAISFNFMPGGLMLVLSTVTLVASANGYLSLTKKDTPINENREEEKSKV